MTSKTPDWDELGSLLLELTAAEVQAFVKAHKGEEFYGFFFDCHSEHGQILLCVNTEEEHRRSLKEYQERWKPRYSAPDSTESLELRWNPGDWKYQGFQSDRFDAAWEKAQDQIEDFFFALPDAEGCWEDAEESFMAMIGWVAVEAENRGVFRGLRRSNGLEVQWADHDEPREDSVQRMAHVRAVMNSAEE